MYDFSFFVDVFFRIINFVVLVLLLAFLFKKYLLESIKQKIHERRQFMRSLEEHLLAVKHQRDLMVATIDKESGLSLQMHQRITIWADAVATELKMRQQEKELIMQTIMHQEKQKEAALLIDQAQQMIVPRVLEQTQAELEKEFADTKVAAQVTGRVMATLRKSV